MGGSVHELVSGLVITLAQARPAAVATGMRWVYLGIDPDLFDQCQQSYGADARLDVTHDFQRVANALREPFIEWVGRVGERQHDCFTWAMSSLDWKMPDASAMFRLLCYRVLLGELVSRETGLLLIVDDEWLFEAARRELPGALFRGRTNIRKAKIRLAVRALASRGYWLLQAFRRLRNQRRASKDQPARPQFDALIYSLPQARNFASDGWDDPFLPGIAERLAERGYVVGRFAPSVPGFERELAVRSALVVPMIEYATAGILLRAALTLARPQLRDLPRLNLSVDLCLLAERELWMELGTSLPCENALFRVTLEKLLDAQRPRVVLYPYESQPWEKLLVLTARPRGIVTIGYQHSNMPRFFLACFPGSGRAERAALPDTILTAGRLQRELQIAGGVTADRIAVGGSARFAQLLSPGQHRRRVGERRRPARVLVAMAHSPVMARAMLRGIVAEFGAPSAREGLELFFRAHPTYPAAHRYRPDWMKEVDGDLAAQLSLFDVVVATGTNVAIEARLLGIPVVVFKAEAEVDMDPSDILPAEYFVYASATELGERIRAAAMEGPVPVPERLLEQAADVFPPLDFDTWLRVLPPASSPARPARAVAGDSR